MLEAWGKYVNANGGINGHPVQVIVKDDGGTPATSLQNVKELVEQDHVVGIIDMSLADSTWASYIASKKVPVIGGSDYEAPFLTNPDFFPSGPTNLTISTAQVQLAKQAGKTDFGVLYCAETPVCAELVPIVKAAATDFGMKSYSAKISSTAPNWTAPCLAAKSNGVDAIFVGDNAATVQRVIASCAQQGYKPLQSASIASAGGEWLADSNFAGTLLASPNANPFDTTVPGIKTFRDALNKYDPSLLSGSSLSLESTLAWAGGMLFKAAAEAGHVTPSSSPAAVTKGLYALKGETLDGLSPPLTFTPGKPANIPCYFGLKIIGGKLATLDSGKPTCLSETQLSAVAKALG